MTEKKLSVDLSRAAWRKSSHSSSNGCVEVAPIDQIIAVRDSKNPGGPVLVFNHREWTAFLGGVADGEFTFPSVPGESSSPSPGGS